jgi:ribosomal protein S8E
MGRGKQKQEKKDGQHRAETKEERRIRLLREKEAKEVSESLKNVFDRRYPARDSSFVSRLLSLFRLQLYL